MKTKRVDSRPPDDHRCKTHAVVRLRRGYGSIRYLGAGRSRPFAVHPPAESITVDGRNRSVRRKAICYVPDWLTGFAVLTAWHAGLYHEGMEDEIALKAASVQNDHRSTQGGGCPQPHRELQLQPNDELRLQSQDDFRTLQPAAIPQFQNSLTPPITTLTAYCEQVQGYVLALLKLVLAQGEAAFHEDEPAIPQAPPVNAAQIVRAAAGVEEGVGASANLQSDLPPAPTSAFAPGSAPGAAFAPPPASTPVPVAPEPVSTPAPAPVAAPATTIAPAPMAPSAPTPVPGFSSAPAAFASPLAAAPPPIPAPLASQPACTVRAVLDRFYDYKYGSNAVRALAEGSAAHARCVMKKLAPIYDRTLDSLSIDELQNLVNSIDLGKTMTSKTILLIKEMYRYALPRGLCTKNPAEYIRMPDRPDHVHHQDFTDAEIAQLWQQKDDPVVTMVLIMCYSGFRVSAYSSLMTNLEEGWLRGGIKTKTGRNRYVPIHSAIAPLVEREMGSGAPYAICRNINYFCLRMKKKMQAIGIDVDDRCHTPHSCRHTFGRLCESFGVKEADRKRMLGHSFGSDITNGVYGHRTVEELRAEIEKIKAPLA